MASDLWKRMQKAEEALVESSSPDTKQLVVVSPRGQEIQDIGGGIFIFFHHGAGRSGRDEVKKIRKINLDKFGN